MCFRNLIALNRKVIAIAVGLPTRSQRFSVLADKGWPPTLKILLARPADHSVLALHTDAAHPLKSRWPAQRIIRYRPYTLTQLTLEIPLARPAVFLERHVRR